MRFIGINATSHPLGRSGVFRRPTKLSNNNSTPRQSSSVGVARVAAKNMGERCLSDVMQQLRPSKTVAVSDLAKSMQEKGHDIISLAAGEPDFPTPAPVAEAAVQAINDGFTKYTQNVGILPLRTAIRQKLKQENGLKYSEECIVVSNGAKQAAFQSILATCGPGDEVVIPAPYWVSYPEMAVLAGSTPVTVPCPISEGFLLTAASLEQVLTEKSRMLILCTPSNPTGAVYNREQLEAIAAVVQKHPRLLVLSDEIYEYMAYPPARHISFASLPGMHERTLTVNGFSKGFAMTGWRLGYLAAPSFYAKGCGTLQSHSTSAPSSISQKAGLAALQMGHKGGSVVAGMVETYRSRRDYVVNRLRAMPGVNVLQPDGAFYVFPEMSAFVGDGVQVNGFGPIDTSEALCMYLLKHASVATVPGEAFGAPGHIRLSYAASESVLKAALDQIEMALADLNKQRENLP